MPWLDSLENRFGRFAIPGLVRILVGFNGLIFLLQFINPNFADALVLDPGRVRAGEVWRLLTWVFCPLQVNPLWVIFALMFYWLMGEGLEEAWGAFRVNLFFFVGMIATTLVAFWFGTSHTNSMLYLSLLFAFATLYPNYTILFMLILPIRVWWLAAASGVYVAFLFLQGGWADRITFLLLFSNYLLFFGPGFLRHTRHRGEVAARREVFEDALPDPGEPMHRCSVCGRTDHSDPYLEFRVGADGADYCADHLPVAKA